MTNKTFEQARKEEEKRLKRRLSMEETSELAREFRHRVPEHAREVRTPEGGR